MTASDFGDDLRRRSLDDLTDPRQARRYGLLVRASSWGRHPICGCESSWNHECGRRNSPSPDPADGWTPSPYGRAHCPTGWACAHAAKGDGNDPVAHLRPCPCSRPAADQWPKREAS